MEAVLPLKISGDYQDFDLQRARILLFSLEKFYNSGKPLIVHVIALRKEMEDIKNNFLGKYNNINVIIHPEDELIQEFGSVHCWNGWMKQQVLKLAAHKLVNSEFYLALDADIVCFREFGVNDMIIDGRAICDWEDRSVHTSWWENSAKIIGVQPNIDDVGMKPTPAIISHKVCQELESFLFRKLGDGFWGKILDIPGWTEFTLYNLFAESIGCMSKFHYNKEEVRLIKKALRGQHNFSTEESFLKWNPEKCFSTDQPGYFMVCNSSSRVDPARIWEKLSVHFCCDLQP